MGGSNENTEKKFRYRKTFMTKIEKDLHFVQLKSNNRTSMEIYFNHCGKLIFGTFVCFFLGEWFDAFVYSYTYMIFFFIFKVIKQQAEFVLFIILYIYSWFLV